MFGLPTVVCLNHRPTDDDREIAAIMDHCHSLGVPCQISNVFAEGGSGGEDLAKALLQILDSTPSQYAPLYELNDSLENKIVTIAKSVYGAGRVKFTAAAKKDLSRIAELGYGNLPVCMAKHSIHYPMTPRR